MFSHQMKSSPPGHGKERSDETEGLTYHKKGKLMNSDKADFIASYGISSPSCPRATAGAELFGGGGQRGQISTINKLCSRKNLARVSSTPGKTATINFCSVDDCCFVDLPGYATPR